MRKASSFFIAFFYYEWRYKIQSHSKTLVCSIMTIREINAFHMEEISTLWRTKRIAAFFRPCFNMTSVLQVACSLDISTTLHFMAQKYATLGAMLLVVKFLTEMLLGGDKPMNLIEKSMLFVAGTAFLGWQYVPVESVRL